VSRSAIKIVKRKDREAPAALCTADAPSDERGARREIVQTIKTWMAESRVRRQEEAKAAAAEAAGDGGDEISNMTVAELDAQYGDYEDYPESGNKAAKVAFAKSVEES